MEAEGVPVVPVDVADGTHLIDVRTFDDAKFGGVYLIDDERRTIIETGTSNDYGNVLAALKRLRVEPASVENIVVTHIHLDHAGGAGFLMDHLTNAKVYVHERGFQHLASPGRLLESAAIAVGEAFEAYGTLKPIPEDRMVALSGGEVLDLGGRELEFIYTPGHARHHLSILDRSSRCIFTGDSAGIYFPDDRRLIPTTPFPEFDLPQALEAMDAMAKLNPRAVLFTHFGPREDAQRALREQRAEYDRWSRRAAETMPEGDLGGAVKAIYEDWYVDVEGFPRRSVERIIETNLKGFYRFFERTMGDAPRRG